MSVATIGSTLAAPQDFPLEWGNAQTVVQSRLAAEKVKNTAEEQEAIPSGQQQGEQESHHTLRSLAADMEQVSLAFNKKLQFVVDHRSNEVIVKVIDKATDKVVRELPPEELQRLHTELKETIGFLFDERV